MAVKTLGNVTVTYNSNALTSHLNTQSIEAVVNEIDTTTFSSTAATKIPGSVNWNIPIGGLWSSALSGFLLSDVVTPPTTLRTLVIVIGASGSQVTYTWTSNAFISNYTVNNSDPTGAITWSGTLAVSGAPTIS